MEEEARSGPRTNWVTLFVAVGIGGALALLAWSALVEHMHSRGAHGNCKNNLKQLGLSLILYRDAHGGGTRYPPYAGADFLVHLYESGQNTEPDQYLCPKSGDSNDEGRLLRIGRTPPRACSYAGRRNRVQGRYPGVFSDKSSSDTALASDDDEGPVRFNHGDAVIVLFLDGHVEEVSLADRKRLGGFGKGGLLDPLAN